jgi:hypothetical protein
VPRVTPSRYSAEVAPALRRRLEDSELRLKQPASASMSAARNLRCRGAFNLIVTALPRRLGSPGQGHKRDAAVTVTVSQAGPGGPGTASVTRAVTVTGIRWSMLVGRSRQS